MGISDSKKEQIDNLINEKMEADENNYNELVKPSIKEDIPQEEQPVLPTEPEETEPPTTEQEPIGPVGISDSKKEQIDNLILEKIENDENNYNEWVKPNIQEEPTVEEPPTDHKPTPRPTEPEQTIPIQPLKGTPDAILYEAQNIQDATSDIEYICTILRVAGYLSDEEANILKDYSIEELCQKFEFYGWERLENSKELQIGDIIILKNGQEQNIGVYAGDNKWYVLDGTVVQEELNLTEDTTWYAYRPSTNIL